QIRYFLSNPQTPDSVITHHWRVHGGRHGNCSVFRALIPIFLLPSIRRSNKSLIAQGDIMNIRKPLIPLALLLLLPVGAFLQENMRGVKFETLVSSTKDWAGDTLSQAPAGQPELSIVRVTIAPGARLPTHKHPVLNSVYVAKGSLKVTLADRGETLTLSEGKAYIEVTDKWHFGRNEGDEPATLIIFYSGVKGVPTTIFQKETETSAP
ncbi:cupin domain-containing protein, partial [Microbulbifer sp. OS29]